MEEDAAQDFGNGEDKLAVFAFVVGEELVPAEADELLAERGAGAAGLVSGRYKKCSEEHFKGAARMGAVIRFCGRLECVYLRREIPTLSESLRPNGGKRAVAIFTSVSWHTD